MTLVVVLGTCAEAVTPRVINKVAESNALRKINFLIFLFLHDFKKIS